MILILNDAQSSSDEVSESSSAESPTAGSDRRSFVWLVVGSDLIAPFVHFSRYHKLRVHNFTKTFFLASLIGMRDWYARPRSAGSAARPLLRTWMRLKSSP